MGLRAKDIEQSSMLGQFARHPMVWLPPNDVDFYTPTIAGTALTVGGALTMNPTRSWGGASSINLSAAAGVANSATVTVLVTGRDENHDPVTEFIALVGTGLTTIITQASIGLFSSLDSVVVTAISGTLVANLYSVGIMAGGATDQVRLPNPFRGIAMGVSPAGPGNMILTVINTGLPGAHLAATSLAPLHTQLLVTPLASNQVRIAAVGIHGQDPRSFLEG